MKEYRLYLWCPDCTNEDPMGCFDGGSELVGRFSTYESAEEKGREEIRDSIWEMTISETDSEVPLTRYEGDFRVNQAEESEQP